MKHESLPCAPISPYAAAKIAGEMYCRCYHEAFGLETVVLRYFNVFGPRQDPQSEYSAVIPRFVVAILSGQQPTVFGDGLQSRDFVYVDDVVRANLAAASAGGAPGRVFNVASGRTHTLLDLIDGLSKALGVEVQPSFEAPREGDVRTSQADISAAREVLGYDPRVGLAEGLERSISYYRRLLSG